MKGGAEFVVGREDDGKWIALGATGLTWSKTKSGSWTAEDEDRRGQNTEACYRNFRRAADKPIPPGKRALVRITIEVLKVLDE